MAYRADPPIPDSLMGVQTRVRQFAHALAAPFTPLDHKSISRVLSPEQTELFYRLQPSERSHSLRVLESLQKHGFTDPDLLAAALLHDVGKNRFPLKLHERVLVVLIVPFSRFMSISTDTERDSRWQNVLRTAREHPRWGAEMVSDAGASELLVWLIQSHQDELPADDRPGIKFLSALQQADREN